MHSEEELRDAADCLGVLHEAIAELVTLRQLLADTPSNSYISQDKYHELTSEISRLKGCLVEAHEAVQVMALMRQHEKEATVVDRGYISERGWNELKDENRRLNERLTKLEAVLEQISAGGWTGSVDRQGATKGERLVIKMAKGALEK